MRMSAESRGELAGRRPQLRNQLPQRLAESGLSEDEVAARVEMLIGARLDRRTLRRYLLGEPILDATAVTLAAICRALDITLDSAVELVAEDPLELLLTAAGMRLVQMKVGKPPPEWGKPDPAWGELVKPFLEERRGRY